MSSQPRDICQDSVKHTGPLSNFENDILMPPKKGNFSWFTSKLPFSGGIKMSFSMPPETGNFFSYLGQKWSDFSDLKVKIP